MRTSRMIRDYDACTYYKHDAGKLLVGAFEPSARPWGVDGIPEDFCFDEIAGNFDHFEPILRDAMARVPALEAAGIQKFFCGPESFTPDVRYHLGQGARIQELLCRRRFEFNRPAICRGNRESHGGMDSLRASAGRPSGKLTCGATCLSRATANT